MGCHSAALVDEVSRKARQRGVSGAELRVGCQCAAVAPEIRNNRAQHGRRCAGPARDLVEQSGQSGRRLGGELRRKERPGDAVQGEVERGLDFRWRYLLLGNCVQRRSQWRKGMPFRGGFECGLLIHVRIYMDKD